MYCNSFSHFNFVSYARNSKWCLLAKKINNVDQTNRDSTGNGVNSNHNRQKHLLDILQYTILIICSSLIFSNTIFRCAVCFYCVFHFDWFVGWTCSTAITTKPLFGSYSILLRLVFFLRSLNPPWRFDCKAPHTFHESILCLRGPRPRPHSLCKQPPKTP